MSTDARDRRTKDLPSALTTFIGRDREIQEVNDLLHREDVRLLTLTGSGGIGKTRLAVEVAAHLTDNSFAFDDVAFVDLAPVSDINAVLSTVGQVLDLAETDNQPIFDQLVATLQGTRILLILDNFEHVRDAALSVTALLHSCPTLKLLVTSRILLRVSAEHAYQLTPLALPDPTSQKSRDELSTIESVRLFIDRARAANPAFRLTDTTAPAVASICALLEGVPLAIELAAVRSNQFSPAALLRELSIGFSLLSDGPRDQPMRQQSIYAAVAWSYELLDEFIKTVFRQLAVFAGGFSLEAARLVVDTSGEAKGEASGAVLSLVDASLVRSRGDANDDPRFELLETVRQYALERLEESGDYEAVKTRHARAFLSLAQRDTASLEGQDLQSWFDRLDADRGNLRAAFDWMLNQGHADLALRLASVLRGLWFNGAGGISEARLWFDRLLSLSASLSAKDRSEASIIAHDLAMVQGDVARAHQLASEILTLLESEKSAPTFNHALSFLAHQGAEFTDAGLDRLLTLFDRALDRAREQGTLEEVCMLLCDKALVLRDRERFQSSMDVLLEALRFVTELGGVDWKVEILIELSTTAGLIGDYAQAWSFYEQAEQLNEHSGNTEIIDNVFWERFWYARAAGDFAHASQLLEQRLEVGRQRGDPEFTIAPFLREFGKLAILKCDFHDAVRAFDEELTIWTKFDNPFEIVRVRADLAKAVDLEGDSERAVTLLTDLLVDVRMARTAPQILFALITLGDVLCRAGRYDDAISRFQEALALSLEHGRMGEAIGSLCGMRRIALVRGEPLLTSSLVQAELQLLKWSYLIERVSEILDMAAYWLNQAGEQQHARQLKAMDEELQSSMARALQSVENGEALANSIELQSLATIEPGLIAEMSALIEHVDEPYLAASMGINLGDLVRRLGNAPDRAKALFDKTLFLVRRSKASTATDPASAPIQIRMAPLEASVLTRLGGLALDQGRLDQAAARYQEAAAIQDPWLTPIESVIGLTAIAAEQGNFELAAAGCGAIEAYVEAQNAVGNGTFVSDLYLGSLIRTSNALDPVEFQRRFSRGRELSLEEMLAQLSDPIQERNPTFAGDGHTLPNTHGLTPREFDVLRLLVQGKTNQEIADALFIGLKTVDTHVSNILRKFGVANRNQAAAYARDNSLI